MGPHGAGPRVLMVGTDPAERGGIAAVVRLYLEAGIGEQCRLRYVVSHAYGAPWSKLIRYLRALMTVTWQLAWRRPALVHVHTASYLSFWRKAGVVWLAAAFRVPVLLHVHGGRFHEFASSAGGGWRSAVIGATLRRATHVAVLSRTHLDLLEPALSVPRSVLPNPVRLPPPGGDGPRGPIVLFLGHLTEAKGLFVLLRAFRRFLDLCPGHRLVLAGFGPDEARLRAETARLGLGNAVDFPGWVGEVEKERLLRGSRMLVLPSFIEGLPVSLLEAMAHGLPVIATPVGGVPELLDGGEAGLLVDAGDEGQLAEAMARLVRDRELYGELQRRGRAKVEREHGAGAVIERLAGLYRQLAGP